MKVYERTTAERRGLHGASEGRRGAALIGVLVVMLGLIGLVHMTVSISNAEVEESRDDLDAVRVRQLGEAGLQRGVLFLSQSVARSSGTDPLGAIDLLFDGEDTLTPFVAQTLEDGANVVGAYTVSMEILERTAASVTVEVRSTGYLPDAPQNLAPGERTTAWHAVSTTVELALAPSEVFDYAYFINNWGWFYGNSIYANGNARSNGQFDVAGYRPTITGQPLYDSVTDTAGTITLSGYRDDNGDGLQDGKDGGLFSGWDIVGAENVKGNGGDEENQHDFQDYVEMPNLSDLSMYEARAAEQGSSLSIGGVQMSDAVFGDDASEQQNLFLVGTLANPIVLDGPVVVRGNVVISGYVTGQGAIYAGGNVYVPDSVQYLDGPSSARPANNTQAATETWLTANWDKDFLGLFARENIVVGDHTDWTWRYYVGNWMGSSMNESAEDAGLDGIPNTRAGRDGILGTADDDVLEGDGVFTVETYTAADAEAGLIPDGFSVGDVVPGSGEDIDGDGMYDDTTTLADIDFDVPLDTANWGGNMPSGGIANYSSIASMYANRLDAVFYTNHSFCYTVLGNQNATINGSLVSRNENVVYGTPKLITNYDARLLGGVTGMAGGLLPSVVQAPRLIRWVELDRDPHRYLDAD